MDFQAKSSSGAVHKFKAESIEQAKKYIEIVLSNTIKWELQGEEVNPRHIKKRKRK